MSAELIPTPKFGDLVENGWASEGNPMRRGYFVQSFRRTGRMNPGLTWEITDGRGKFWEFRPSDIGERLTVTPIADALASKDEEIAALKGALALVKHEKLKLEQALQGDADVSRYGDMARVLEVVEERRAIYEAKMNARNPLAEPCTNRHEVYEFAVEALEYMYLDIVALFQDVSRGGGG